MSEPYSRSVQPAMSALHVRLYSSDTDRTTEPLLALVDTGADATIVPVRQLLEIGAEETAPGWLRGITGERMPVALYFIDIRLEHMTIPGVRVVASATEEFALLGRDVLNKLPLFLDGPQQQTEVLDDDTANRLRTRREQ
jgi:predicted aspartyl protease